GRNWLLRSILPELAGDDLVVFLDNDVEVHEHWYETFVKLFATRPRAGIAGAMGHPIIVHSDHRELLPSPSFGPASVDVVSGFCFWTRPKTARAVGFFDERLGRFWHEDDDYCVRAVNLGYEVFAIPNTPITHYGHKSGVAEAGIAADCSLENQRYLAGKWRQMGCVDAEGRIIHRGFESDGQGLKIVAYILSCPEREVIRRQTIENLQASDCPCAPSVEIDQTTFERRQERQVQTARRLLQRAITEGSESDYILFLEDDLQFNRHLLHNLESWHPIKSAKPGEHFFGSLYNPNVRALTRSPERAFLVADPETVFGSQAFVLSPATARYIVAHWEEVIGMQDMKMSRLAARVCPIYYHVPSLVQHIGYASVWGGHYHWASDFSDDWRA